MTRIIALLDACVIFPYPLVDTLFRAAEKGLYQVYFSERILLEATRNRVKRGKMSEEGAQRFRANVINAFPDAICEAPPELEDMMTNDIKDRHVLASAVHVKEIHERQVDVIVTSNLKDFPPDSLNPHGIRAVHPDNFLIELCDKHGDYVLYDLIAEQASSYKKSNDPNQPNKIPPVTDLELIARFEKEQPLFASKLLVCEYCDEIAETCYMILKVGTLHNNKRCLCGKNYTICSGNYQLEIIEKVTNRIVLRIDEDDNVAGDFKVRDVLYFQAFRDTASDDIDVLAAVNWKNMGR